MHARLGGCTAQQPPLLPELAVEAVPVQLAARLAALLAVLAVVQQRLRLLVAVLVDWWGNADQQAAGPVEHAAFEQHLALVDSQRSAEAWRRLRALVAECGDPLQLVHATVRQAHVAVGLA
ncbi:hypothetical protein [Mumia zhuanghuii]|uniref:Uncharacterized protein n=1 Tax=Mumia zhuanghuii TaxID=2585211 RepID=A0A5C4LUQ1_9ACTN|nr:hypothetical protein [Mumia zhuanghuii]TNC22176.1 hypothetical protein FHE65_35855 [Mumia zhuanghuii]